MNRAATSEPRTELRAEPGQAWPGEEQVRRAKRPRWSTQASYRRTPEERSSYREVFAGGAAAQAIAPLAVCPAGLVGVIAASMLAMSWTHLRGRLIQAQRGEAEALGA